MDVLSGEEFNVTSTHHQMIRPTIDALKVVTARESTKRSTMSKKVSSREYLNYGPHEDIEACFYEEQKAFCFQPHPEFQGHVDLADRYFGYLAHHLGV